MTDFGPTGKLVFERTYSRVKPSGEREAWEDTVQRVVGGNLALVDERHQLPRERERLTRLMNRFKVIPAGRQLWATGVKGRQYLYNCFVSGWDATDPAEHFRFTFMRLMEGGGVGANYSNRHLSGHPPIATPFSLSVHIVCDPEHPDYETLKDSNFLSEEFVDDWGGCFQVEDSREGWAEALVDLIHTFYRPDATHRNRVYDVSRVRGAGAKLKTYGGYASGPGPLAKMLHEVAGVFNDAWLSGDWLTGMDAMEIDHAIAQCVVAGGNRRSARMSIMHWDDPQIFEFLSSKRETGSHWSTNISVEVDARFREALEEESADGMHARTVLKAVAEGMLRDGEPGIWDSSLSNEGEPNVIQATNPCGEIPLEPWEACNLGHVNLAAFANHLGFVDFEGLYEAHQLMTRFLIRATFGDRNDESQAEVMDRNRRIGLGHFGFAEFVNMLGVRYSEAPDELSIRKLLTDLAAVVDSEAIRFAHDLRIPVPVKKRTVAPTGTIAKLPGTSEGIHPIFAKHFVRRIRFSDVDPEQVETAEAYRALGYQVEPCVYAANTTVVSIPTKDIVLEHVAAVYGQERAEEIVESADDLTLNEMLDVQEMYQTFWADNAVSYTANIDPEVYTVEDIEHSIRQHLGWVKGFTVFPELSREQSPYERISKEEYESVGIRNVQDSVDEQCQSGACPVR